MKSKGLILTIACIAVFAVLATQVSTAIAAMCDKCRDLMFIESQGKCIDCGGPTASGALQLCPKCSARRHQCEHCLAKLAASDETPAEPTPTPAAPAAAEKAPRGDADILPGPASSGPSDADHAAKRDDGLPPISPATPPALQPVPKTEETTPLPKPSAEAPAAPAASAKLKPIHPARPGIYTAGKWRFQLQIANPGTPSEGRWGWLTYNGQLLPRGNINDYYETPWGPMYWIGAEKIASGMHGFMPIPSPPTRFAGAPPRKGRPLTLPASLLASTPLPTDPANTGAAPAAKVQTLEINRSHNGQMARLHVGNVLIIRLPGNPATGYQWQAGTTNTPAVRMTVRPQYSPPAAAGAAVGTYTFVFQAVQAGGGPLRLFYVHPNDTSRPRDTFAIGVNVSPPATAMTPARAAALSGESR